MYQTFHLNGTGVNYETTTLALGLFYWHEAFYLFTYFYVNINSFINFHETKFEAQYIKVKNYHFDLGLLSLHIER